MCDPIDWPGELEMSKVQLRKCASKHHNCDQKKISAKIKKFDEKKLKNYKTTELINEAEKIILKKELGKPPRDKLWSILDAPTGSYYGPKTLHKVPAVKYKRNLMLNQAFWQAYCVRKLSKLKIRINKSN